MSQAKDEPTFGLGYFSDWERLADEQLAAASLVEKMLPRRGQTLLSADPMAGKTSLVAELAVCAPNALPFLGHTIREQAGVIWINCDRTPEKNIVRKMRRLCKTAEHRENCQRLFRPVLRESLPKHVDRPFLERLIEVFRHQSKHSGCILVVLDSLRSCFLRDAPKGAENDPSVIAEALVPVRDLAMTLDLAVLTLHHNSRNSGQYAGSGMILGSVDSYWNLERKLGSQKSYLEVIQRDDEESEPFKLEITNTKEGFAAHHVAMKGQPAKTDPYLNVVPFDEKAAVTIAEIAKAANETKEAPVRRRMNKLEEDGLVIRRGGGAGQGPLRYWRSTT